MDIATLLSINKLYPLQQLNFKITRLWGAAKGRRGEQQKDAEGSSKKRGKSSANLIFFKLINYFSQVFGVLWCSWLALETLNLASWVRIPVGPFINIKLEYFNLI
jgi:hypothetical protein